eukprot:ANDGO_04643.mRNA.1 hypothetical protein CAOG_03194
MKWTIQVIVVLLAIAVSVVVGRSRIADSPYPLSAEPPANVLVLNGSCIDPALTTVFVSLTGLLARSASEFFFVQTSADSFWLSDAVQQKYLNSVDSTLSCDAKSVLAKYQPKFPRYVLCNESSPNSILNAYAIASALGDVLVSTVPAARLLDALGFAMLYDARSMSFSEILSKFDSSFSRRVLVVQDPSKAVSYLSDYGVFSSAPLMFCTDCAKDASLHTAGKRLSRGTSVILGWGTSELDLVTTASELGAAVHAADWAYGLSLYTNLLVPSTAFRHSLARNSKRTGSGKHSVAFLMTDGDNIQWMLNGFAFDPKWYASPQRGSGKIGWTLSPALAELAPNVYSFILRHATANDSFVDSPSGFGYGYLDKMSSDSRLGFSQLTGDFLATYKASGGVVNVLDISSDLDPVADLTRQPSVRGVIQYMFSDYSGLKGRVQFSNGKPVVGGRYNLWAGFETPKSLAQKLNSASTRTDTSDGYSLIPVHVWSMTVADVVACIQLLDSSRVQVVSPSELIDLIASNILHH